MGQDVDLLVALFRRWDLFPPILPQVPSRPTINWLMLRYHLPVSLLLLAVFLCLSLRRVPSVLAALEVVPDCDGIRFQILFPRSVWIPFPPLIVLHTVLMMWQASFGTEVGVFWFMLPMFTCLVLHFTALQRLQQIGVRAAWLAVVASGILCLIPPLNRLGHVLFLNPIGLMWALCAALYIPALWVCFALAPGLMLRELTRSFPGFLRYRGT